MHVENFPGIVLTAQLGRREVDRDPRGRQSHPPPAPAIRGRLLDHPGAGRRHQTGGFEQRQKMPRRDQSILRIVPAQQRLHPVDPAGAQRDLRLVVQDELLAARAPPAVVVPC